MSEKKPKKPKKEKIVYVDDGRTIADMSPLDEARKRGGTGRNAPKREAPRPRATFREQLDTYFAAVKMMLGPMFVTMGIISLAFLLLWLWAR